MSTDSLIAIGIAVIAGTFATISYVHSSFLTLREGDAIIKQLDRIEKKLDAFVKPA